jgi:hypothetical protein
MRCDRLQGGACPLPPPALRGSDPSSPGCRAGAHSAADQSVVLVEALEAPIVATGVARARGSAKTSMLESRDPLW